MNKKQLQRIIENKIEEKTKWFDHNMVGFSDVEQRTLGGKISILHWVLEVIDNPNKWDE